MKAYIARETLAPAFPENVDEIVDLMTEELEELGYEVVVGDHSLSNQPWRAEEFAAEEAVEKAWQNACSRVQDYLMG